MNLLESEGIYSHLGTVCVTLTETKSRKQCAALVIGCTIDEQISYWVHANLTTQGMRNTLLCNTYSLTLFI